MIEAIQDRSIIRLWTIQDLNTLVPLAIGQREITTNFTGKALSEWRNLLLLGWANACCSTTTAYGAAAALSFDGSEIFLYGGTGPDHGTFKIQLDDQPAITLTGTSPISHPNALLVSLCINELVGSRAHYI